jgi:hypothetical protein
LEHAAGETGRGIDAIRSLMAAERTGCLRVYVPARGEALVYLLDGDVIAATTPDDASSLLGRLTARGRVPADIAKGLNEAAPLTMTTLERAVQATAVERLMAGRFRDNLIFFLFDGGRFEFEEMETVRIPHIQMGHDSAGLLRELEVVHGRIAPWMNVQRVRRITSGDKNPGSPQQRHIQALCTAGVRLDKLVEASPFFPAQTLVLVAQMIDRQSLIASVLQMEEGPKQGAVDHAIEMARMEAERRSSLRDTGLTAFADHERSGRGPGKGEFTGGSDRVDLEAPPVRRPGLRTAAPSLDSQEIVRRIGVCNEVLQAFVHTWDDQHGAGEGRRVAQLILDTAPGNCSALFERAMVDGKGRIGASRILANVERRPEAQRRELVRRGLSDLIDRTLARGADGLDDAHLDRMLTRVAGYRQRLGW